MSQLQSIKGKKVFMVLYNYSDCDYSIVKIKENLSEAYEYICHQEYNYCDKQESFTMIEVLKYEDINKKYVDNFINICYISSGKYNKFNLCDYSDVSQYVIVPMNIS